MDNSDVNSFRIKESLLFLSDEKAMKQFTIEALAHQCGFGNKTSFYKAFKKTTGKTPSDFQKISNFSDSEIPSRKV